jgi:cell division protein FtsL
MSAIVEAGRPTRRPKVAPRRRTWLLSGGVFWIVLLALLLTGVVAVNVAVLRLNLKLDHQNQEQVQLHTDIARLRSEISTAAATTRVERLARGELGLVQVQPEDTTYIELPR